MPEILRVVVEVEHELRFFDEDGHTTSENFT